MGKKLPDAVLDLQADDLIANGNEMVLCNAEPTTYTQAHATFMLVAVVIDSGDYTKGDGDVDGRKVTIGEQAEVATSVAGTGTHVAIIDTIEEVLKTVTTCDDVVISYPGLFTFPSWKMVVRDPT